MPDPTMTPSDAAAVLRCEIDAIENASAPDCKVVEALTTILDERERDKAEIERLRGKMAVHSLWRKSLALRVERLKQELPGVVGDIDTARPTKAAFIAMGRMQNRLAERGEPVDYSSRSPVSIEDICDD